MAELQLNRNVPLGLSALTAAGITGRTQLAVKMKAGVATVG